jgi:PPOX class probable FMN-dependent enzyme
MTLRFRTRRVPLTTATTTFDQVICTEDELRAILGIPSRRAATKQIDRIDHNYADFIARSPLVLIGSSGADGRQDISPKGDPAGFVLVLNEHTLAIPDRPGNRRADTFVNVLQNPNVALFFLVPGSRETLRVQGRASIVRDAALRERMAVNGKLPDLALVVTVEEAFMHCAKCMVRSQLWQPDSWPDPEEIPSLSGALVEQKQLPITREQLAEALEQDIRERLY